MKTFRTRKFKRLGNNYSLSKTKRVYIKTISAAIMLSLSFTHNLSSEKALASPILGNATIALENATAALNNATEALRNASQQPAEDDVEGLSNNSILSIETRRDKYAIGGPIEVFGNLTTTNRTMANSPIRIIISLTLDESQTIVNNITANLINDTLSIVGGKPQIYQPIPSSELKPVVNMTLNVINGSYSYRGLIPSKDAGIYQVTATTTDNKTALAFFEFVNPYYTLSFFSVIFSIGFFGLLICTVLWYGKKREPRQDPMRPHPSDDKIYYKAEIFRFIALTGLSVSLIFAFGGIETDIDPDAPIGIVNINSESSNEAFTQWAINFGGSRADNYQSGLIIPIYVIVLGLVGGFMRYLHKAYTRTANPKEEEERKRDEMTRAGFEHYTFGELSDIVIAPILALAVWFILHQEIQSVFLLAALSLTLGLVTPNIIEGLKQFATSTSRTSQEGKKAE